MGFTKQRHNFQWIRKMWMDRFIRGIEEPPMPEITDNCIQALRDNHMIDEELSEICETESDLDDGCIYDDFTIILD